MLGIGIVAAWLWALAAPVKAQVTITDLGPLSNSTYSQARAVSGDGSTVAGISYGRGATNGTVWNAGPMDLGSLGRGRTEPAGVSRDGSVVVGVGDRADGVTRAFRWTVSTGLTDLGSFAPNSLSAALGVSGDGSVVVGVGRTTGTRNLGFRWASDTGLVDIGSLGVGDTNPRATNHDGSVIVGDSQNAAGQTRAFIWTNGDGIREIQFPTGSTYGVALDVNSDGTVVVGMSDTTCFRWSATDGFELLPRIPSRPLLAYWPTGMDDSGRIVIGRAWEQSVEIPVIWVNGSAAQELGGFLRSRGVDTTGWDFSDASGISNDGSTIVGTGTYLGQQRAFKITGLSFDFDAPTISASVSPSTPSSGWHVGDVQVTLESSDGTNGSGVKEIRYSVDMGPEQVVAGSTTTFTVTTEGIHTISFQAVDKAGNTSASQFITVKIEKTAPQSSANKPDVPSGWYSGNVDVDLVSVDPVGGSGVREIRYTVDMGAEQVVSGDKATVSLSSEGVHAIAFYGVDSAGNLEPTRFVTVKIDKTGATATATPSPSPNAAGWNKAPVVVKIQGTDGGSDVREIRYSLDMGAAQTATGSEVDVPIDSEGVHVLAFSAVDKAGNQGASQEITIRVDRTNPTISGVETNGKLTLTGADSLSGIARIAYRIDNGTEQTYQAPVTLPSGSSKVEYWSEDRAGNQSPVERLQVGQKVMALTVNPTVPYAGSTVTVRIDVALVSAAGGTTVQLSSNRPGILPLPEVVMIPEGSKTATISLVAGPVSTSTTVNLAASFGESRVTTDVVVKVPVPKSLTLAPSIVTGGYSATGTVTLVSKAPEGGLTVPLTSLDVSAVDVPSSVMVPAGASQASFAIATKLVSVDKAVGISAVVDGTSVIRAIVVRRIVPASVKLNPATVTGGLTSTGTVTVSQPAPSTGMVVELTSSSPAAQVPSSITIAAGSKIGTFTIVTSSVASNTSATITAKTSGVSKSAVLRINR